jgi:hypothetical protein
MKVKWCRYRHGVAQRVGRGTALLFHDRGTGRGWVVSSTPQPHFTPGKDPVPILQKAGWAPGPVWTGGKSRPHRDSIPDRPDRSLYIYIYIYIAKLVFVKLPLVLCYFLLLQAKYSFHSPVLNALSLRCSLSIRDRASHACKSTSTVIR